MARIDLPNFEDMDERQQQVFNRIKAGPRGNVIGPLRAAIHSPELADRWSHFGEFIRYETSIPRRYKELAIVVTGRHWSSAVEWWVHAEEALKEGVCPNAIQAIKSGEAPRFKERLDRLVYEFARETLELGQPSSALYDDVVSNWGAKGVVELSAVIGYYTMVAITLNAHEIPLPAGAGEGLTGLGEGRFTLAPAMEMSASHD